MKPKNMFLATAKGMVLLLFMCCFVHPANAYDISGTISTEDGLPMSHGQFQVNVFVSGSGGVCENIQHLAGGVTDEVGEYSITNIAENNPTIYAQVQGGMYVPEWYAGEDVNGSPVSSPRCEDAVPIVFSNGSNNSIDFVVALGGSISGALFMSDGSTAITGQTNLGVNVWKGNNPCDAEHIMGRPINPADGTFLLNGLEPGQYYLRVFNNGDSHYIEEHWDASGQSVRNCADADPITVTVSQTASGKNFQLEQGGSISGTFYQADGTTPITGQPGLGANVWKEGSNACEAEHVKGTNLSEDGRFVLTGLEAGRYFLKAFNNGETNYVEEYWNAQGGVPDCSQAVLIEVTVGQDAGGRNFQLDLGGSISGTVSDSAGTVTSPSLGITVRKGATACTSSFVKGVMTDDEGKYTIHGVAPGEYYVKNSPGDTKYWEMYYRTPTESVRWTQCAQVLPVTIVSNSHHLQGIDFRLEENHAGDVNGDGHKNLQDLILSLRSITGHIDSEVSKAGDFDGDNKIGLLEAIYILNELTENN